MIRLAFRALGLLFVAAALGAVIMDGARSIAASAVTLTALEPFWLSVHPASFGWFREFVLVRLAPTVGEWIWSPLTTGVLASPVSVAFAGLGFLALVVGAGRRPAYA